MPLGLSAGITTAKNSNVHVPIVEGRVLIKTRGRVRQLGQKRDPNQGLGPAGAGCAEVGQAEAEQL